MLVLSAVWDLTITAKSLDMEVLCLLGKSLRVEWVDQGCSLNFLRNCQLSTVIGPVYISSSSTWECQLLYIL